MLAIKREQFYKNKLFLRGVAVLAGFVFTVGIIRSITPTNDTANQSASDGRASSLIPINASDSESSSESDKNDNSSKASAAPISSKSRSSWVTPTSQASKPAASGASITPATSQGSTTAQTSTQPSGGSGSSGETDNDGLLAPITCTVLNIGC